MKYLVIGCSECDWIWITKADQNKTVTCPMCGKQYDKQKRRSLGAFEGRTQATTERRKILEDRWDA